MNVSIDLKSIATDKFINLMRLRASPILPNVVTIQLAESSRLQPTVHEGHLNAETFRFAIVASRWNELISARLVEGALDALKRLGARDEQVDLYRVPGSFEIPLLALRLAQTRKFDAIICLGTIIRGQTPHFDYIAAEVAHGISHAALTTGIPVIFGIVTADTVDQAIDRAGVKLGNKGFEAAMTAVELVNLYKEAFE
jgi:6,7-dimethyl-8-ribityllumazine synthase